MAEANTLVAKHYNEGDFPSGGTVITAKDITFTALLQDVGYGTVTMLLSDAYVANIDPGDMISIDIAGSSGTPVRAFAFIVEDVDQTTIGTGAEPDEIVVFTGPGHLAILGDGVIEPAGGPGWAPTVVDFVFDFTHPDYDDSGGEWVAPTVVTTVEAAKDHYIPFTTTIDHPSNWHPEPWAPDFPQHALSGYGSGTTDIIWSADGSLTSGTAGKVAARCPFTSPYDGVLVLFAAGVHVVETYVDGKQISVGGGAANVIDSGYTHTQITSFAVSAGDHLLAIKATRYPAFSGAASAGFAAALYVPGYPPTLVFETKSSGTKIVDHPSEWPGMTVGTVLDLMLAQHSGTFGAYVTPTFSDTQDSASAAWNPANTQIAARSGYDTDLSIALKIMTSYADVWMDPSSWDLHAVNWGTRDAASGVTFDATNLTLLKHRRQRISADELMVLWSGGYTRVGSGNVQKFLELGPEDTPEEISRLGLQALDVFDHPREQITFSYVALNDTQLPWVNAAFVPGSLVTCPSRTGGSVSERVMQITVTFNDQAEYPVVSLIVKDLILQAQERILNDLKVN